MVDKEELEFTLRRTARRVQFRSESRVKSSLFFHVIYATLIELNRMNEEFVEEILKRINQVRSFRG